MEVDRIKNTVRTFADWIDACLMLPEDAITGLVALGMTEQEATEALEAEYNGRLENNNSEYKEVT